MKARSLKRGRNVTMTIPLSITGIYQLTKTK